MQVESWFGEAGKYDASVSGRESEVRVRALFPGGDDKGRPCRSSKDVRGGEEVRGRAEGVWGMRSPSILRELRLSRAVLQGREGEQWRRLTRGGVLGGERTVRGRPGGADGVGRVRGDVCWGVGRRVSCHYCGREVTVRNMARHLRQYCRVWDTGGGGAIVVSGERPEEEGRCTSVGVLQNVPDITLAALSWVRSSLSLLVLEIEGFYDCTAYSSKFLWVAMKTRRAAPRDQPQSAPARCIRRLFLAASLLAMLFVSLANVNYLS